jgi:hypothetical protein
MGSIIRKPNTQNQAKCIFSLFFIFNNITANTKISSNVYSIINIIDLFFMKGFLFRAFRFKDLKLCLYFCGKAALYNLFSSLIFATAVGTVAMLQTEHKNTRYS